MVIVKYQGEFEDKKFFSAYSILKEKGYEPDMVYVSSVKKDNKVIISFDYVDESKAPSKGDLEEMFSELNLDCID